jgi:hypothetical protein
VAAVRIAGGRKKGGYRIFLVYFLEENAIMFVDGLFLHAQSAQGSRRAPDWRRERVRAKGRTAADEPR